MGEQIRSLEEEVFEFQQEKTQHLIQREQLLRKMTMEKNDLITEKEMLQAQLDDISKKRDQLKAENQKLKKSRGNPGPQIVQGHSLKGRFEPFQNILGNSDKSFLAFESNLPSFYQRQGDRSSIIKTQQQNDDSLEKELLDEIK